MSLWWPPSISERPVEHGLLDFALAFQRDLFFFWSSHLYMGGAGEKWKRRAAFIPTLFYYYMMMIMMLLGLIYYSNRVNCHLSSSSWIVHVPCYILSITKLMSTSSRCVLAFYSNALLSPLSVLVYCLLSRCCQHLSLGTCAIKWLTWWNVEEGSFIAIFIPWGALCLLRFLRTIILTRLWSKRYLNVIVLSKEEGEYFCHFWQFWLWQVRRSSRPNRNAFLPHQQYIWFWTKIYFPNSDDTNIRSCQNSYGFGWAANRPPINHKIVYWKTNCFLMLLMLWI